MKYILKTSGGVFISIMCIIAYILIFIVFYKKGIGFNQVIALIIVLTFFYYSASQYYTTIEVDEEKMVILNKLHFWRPVLSYHLKNIECINMVGSRYINIIIVILRNKKKRKHLLSAYTKDYRALENVLKKYGVIVKSEL